MKILSHPLPILTMEEMKPIMAKCKQGYTTAHEAYARWWKGKIPPAESTLIYCWGEDVYFKNLPGYADGINYEVADKPFFGPLTEYPGLVVPTLDTQVNKGGKPVILFHGSANRFDKFEGDNNFFSTDPLVAQGFCDVSATMWGRPGFNPTLYAVVIEASNLADGVARRLVSSEIKWNGPEIGGTHLTPVEDKHLIDPSPSDNRARDAQLAGECDCVVWRNVKDPMLRSDVYHVANPSQIKILHKWEIVMKDDGISSGFVGLDEAEMIHHGFINEKETV